MSHNNLATDLWLCSCLHVDGEAPVVKSCPKRQQKRVGQDGGKKVTWDEPQFEDNSGVVTVTSQSHKSGDRFQLGKTRVSYLAEDPSGNPVHCNFTVRVVRKCMD